MRQLIPYLPVADVSQTVDFYQRVLGFELVRTTGRGEATLAHVRCGQVELVFRTAASGGSGQTHLPYPDRVRLQFDVGDVAALYRRATAVMKPGQMLRPLERNLFGLLEFEAEDRNGFVLVFSQLERCRDASSA